MYDVYDVIGDKTDDYLLDSNIYVGDSLIPLRIGGQYDLAPYYPYLVSSVLWAQNCCDIRFSAESYIDIREREGLTWKLDKVKNYWRTCKQKKEQYDIESAIHEIVFLGESDGDEYDIANRVYLDGENADIDGLHDIVCECYREKLFKEMIWLGWDDKAAETWIWKGRKRTHINYDVIEINSFGGE